MIVLMTSLYQFRDAGRRAEIIQTVNDNLANRFIDKVVIFWENAPDQYRKGFDFYDHPKVVHVDTDHRPSYGDMFRYANEKHSGEFIIVANSDIIFPEQIQYFYGRDWTNILWCVTRHNITADGLELQGKGVNGSSDAWIFQAPLPEFEWDIKMGVIGCDSYLVQKAGNAGLSMLNPCRWLVIQHRHTVGERNDTPGGWNYWQEPDYAGCTVQPTEPQGG